MKKGEKKRGTFSHLTHAQRDRLEIMLREGDEQKEIAKVLGVSPSTICREKKRTRKKDPQYSATIAQQKANAKRASSKYCGMAMESDLKRKKYIIDELKKHRSPDEIAGRIALEKLFKPIGKDAIYSWLYSTRGNQYVRLLCTKRKKRKLQKRHPKREMIPNRIPLKERPKQGIHAQADTFLSKKRDGTEAVAIVCVPDAQLALVGKVPSMSPEAVCPVFGRLLSHVTVNDVTFDNGIENKHHETLPVSAYFCEPHHPWEKPDVENIIGLCRRWFFPKGTNFADLSEEQLQAHVHILNGKYRKSLGYRSAYEVALERGIITEAFVAEKTLAAEKYFATSIALGGRI